MKHTDKFNSIVSKSRISRRSFVAGAASAIAGFTIVPRYVLGGAGFKSPSEKLNIAAVGIGGQGKGNIKACEGENIVALCDVDWNFAGQVFQDYPKAAKYKDFRKMLEKEKGIDAVVVATPDHTHATIAMMAIKMGKHVYVQKPLTWSIDEARKLTQAARENKVATQMGNQDHSSEEIRVLCEMIWAGAIGDIREVHAWTDRPQWLQGIARPTDTPHVPANLDWDLWLGPAPTRPYHRYYHPFAWRGWLDFGTGALGDMGCHIIDNAFWALKLGHPISVEAYASQRVLKDWEKMENKETYPDASIVRYEFPARGNMPAVKLTWYDGGLKPARPAELEKERNLGSNGVIFIGDKGVIMDGRLIPDSKMTDLPRPPKTIPRITGTHEQNWIDACKGGPAACSNFEYSGPLTEVVLLGSVAVRTGKLLEWDGPNMKITNVPEVNELLRRNYRDGWTL
ncbi:MAG: Gfo/Idh/MocA family oxidoreductase [Planctomycetota bacterium]